MSQEKEENGKNTKENGDYSFDYNELSNSIFMCQNENLNQRENPSHSSIKSLKKDNIMLNYNKYLTTDLMNQIDLSNSPNKEIKISNYNQNNAHYTNISPTPQTSLDENVPSFFPKKYPHIKKYSKIEASPVLKNGIGIMMVNKQKNVYYENKPNFINQFQKDYGPQNHQQRPYLTPKIQNMKNFNYSYTPKNKTPNATKISLSLNEITQINQMQFNQLQKINQVKQLQSKPSKKVKTDNSPNLSSSSNKENINENSYSNYSPNIISPNLSSNKSKKGKKQFSERAGDWVCVKCKNLNFSFRSICNRCQLTKTDNDKLYEQYMNNLLNYCKINDMLHTKYSSPNTSFPQWIPIQTSSQGNGVNEEENTDTK